MANRRLGGGYGGGHGGGRPFNNYTNAMSGAVNPWQVGNMPGGQGGGPFNPGGQSHLLSQLSDPQAQLALALTQLLKPQQSVPSLLTMDTVNPHQPGSGGGGHYRNHNYPPRGRDNMPMNMNNRRPRTDFKRIEPYNKMNSRSDNKRGRNDSSSRRGNASKVDRKGPANRSNAASKTANKAKTSSKPSAKSEKKATSTTTKPVDKEQSAADVDKNESTVAEVDVSEDNIVEETEETDAKRDWKEEKSNEESGEPEEAKEDVAEVEEAVKESDEKKDDDKEKTDKVNSKTRKNKYCNIPKSLLECHICVKKMWDGESYEKHLNGKAHRQMLDQIAESYQVKVDMMREAIRLSEAKKSIEIDRMKRLGKNPKNTQRSRCAMCDLEFHGQLFVHRKSASHQKLKYFLHPRCAYCNKEFPTRIEWENHRHSIDHLRQKAKNPDKDKKKNAKNQKEEDEILIDDECFVVLDSVENEDDEDYDENALTDLTDDLADDVPILVPTYKSNRSVGLSLITPVTGHYCKPCSRFFISEEACQQHAQSRSHFNAFVNILNEKITENEERKRKQTDGDQGDDEGNWKRRKISKDDDQEDKNEEDDEVEEVNDDGVISVKDDDEDLNLTKEEDRTGTKEDRDLAMDEDVIKEEVLDITKKLDLDMAQEEELLKDDEPMTHDESMKADGSDLYDPAETFTATDPNDVKLNDNISFGDEVTNEIYSNIEEILQKDEPIKKEDIIPKKEPMSPKKDSIAAKKEVNTAKPLVAPKVALVKQEAITKQLAVPRQMVPPKQVSSLKQETPAKQDIAPKQVIPPAPKPPAIRGKNPVARRGRIRK